jgi:hypothetical protein
VYKIFCENIIEPNKKINYESSKKKPNLKRNKHFTFIKKTRSGFWGTETTDPTTATATTVTTTGF